MATDFVDYDIFETLHRTGRGWRGACESHGIFTIGVIVYEAAVMRFVDDAEDCELLRVIRTFFRQIDCTGGQALVQEVYHVFE